MGGTLEWGKIAGRGERRGGGGGGGHGGGRQGWGRRWMAGCVRLNRGGGRESPLFDLGGARCWGRGERG